MSGPHPALPHQTHAPRAIKRPGPLTGAWGHHFAQGRPPFALKVGPANQYEREGESGRESGRERERGGNPPTSRREREREKRKGEPERERVRADATQPTHERGREREREREEATGPRQEREEATQQIREI